jgi:hypothetical protein
MKLMKKLTCTAVAACMALSATAVAGAANIEDQPYYHGVDWSTVDTSMCQPDTDWHFYPQTGIIQSRSSYRPVFSGWVYGVPANTYTGTSTRAFVTDLSFEDGESGEIQVTLNDSQDYNKANVNVSVYDKSAQRIVSYVTLENKTPSPTTKYFYVTPSHNYDLYISHQGSGIQNESLNILVR